MALQQAIAGSLADIRGEGSRLGPASLAALVAWSGSGAVAKIGALNAGRVARFATALVDWRLALARWDSELVPASQEAPFESPVTLMFGNLPDSFLVSSR